MGAPNSFPSGIASHEEFHTVLQSGVLNGSGPAIPFLSPKLPLVTVGSCFASYVTKHLREINYDVFNLSMSDRLFSPVALKYFFENIAGDTTGFQSQWNVEASGIKALAERLVAGAAAIITFGMSVHWIDTETGDAIFDPGIKVKKAIVRSSRYVMHHTSLDENIEAIAGIIAAIKRLNPANRVILTLSPIPMAYSQDLPVVVADCISKSTLRIAIAEVMRASMKEVYYFPSYELLKWLAPMVDRIWGADGLLVHIRPEWIKYTLEQFSELFCVGHKTEVLPPVVEYPRVPPKLL